MQPPRSAPGTALTQAAVREWQHASSKAGILVQVSSISVVIPAFDDAEMLTRCLDALAAGKRAADEIIVADNDSADATASVARSAGARVIVQAMRGIWPAASAGYDAAHGDLIARLDADSVPPLDWLERIEAAFEADPELSLITGPGDFVDGNVAIRLIGRYWYVGGYFWAMTLWLGHRPVFGSNFAMRARVWESVRTRVHREARAIHDDLDLSLHLTPDQVVRLDASLRVGISSRPLRTWRGLGRRLGWAYLTLRLH